MPYIDSDSNIPKSVFYFALVGECLNEKAMIYWKDQETERLKKMQSFFYSKVFKQGSLH